jgi:hypothetical protein
VDDLRRLPLRRVDAQARPQPDGCFTTSSGPFQRVKSVRPA